MEAVQCSVVWPQLSQLEDCGAFCTCPQPLTDLSCTGQHEAGQGELQGRCHGASLQI